MGRFRYLLSPSTGLRVVTACHAASSRSLPPYLLHEGIGFGVLQAPPRLMVMFLPTAGPQRLHRGGSDCGRGRAAPREHCPPWSHTAGNQPPGHTAGRGTPGAKGRCRPWALHLAPSHPLTSYCSIWQEHTCVLHSIVGWGSTVGRWARVEGTPNDPNPNDPRAHMDSESLFKDGKLLPAITILGMASQGHRAVRNLHR